MLADRLRGEQDGEGCGAEAVHLYGFRPVAAFCRQPAPVLRGFQHDGAAGGGALDAAAPVRCLRTFEVVSRRRTVRPRLAGGEGVAQIVQDRRESRRAGWRPFDGCVVGGDGPVQDAAAVGCRVRQCLEGVAVRDDRPVEVGALVTGLIPQRVGVAEVAEPSVPVRRAGSRRRHRLFEGGDRPAQVVGALQPRRRLQQRRAKGVKEPGPIRSRHHSGSHRLREVSDRRLEVGERAVPSEPLDARHPAVVQIAGSLRSRQHGGQSLDRRVDRRVETGRVGARPTRLQCGPGQVGEESRTVHAGRRTGHCRT